MSLQIIQTQLPGMYDAPAVPLAYVRAHRVRRYPPMVDEFRLPPAMARAPGPISDVEDAGAPMARPWWRQVIARWLGF